MVTSSAPSGAFSNLSCARCHKAEEDLGERLKRCARCHTVGYCSRECQRLQWPAHKARCGAQSDRTATATTQVAGRYTMRMSMAGMRNTTSPTATTATDNDTIYYLQTSTPHIYDISMSGPYHSLEAIRQQMYHNFGSEYPIGCTALDEYASVFGMEHITSPSRVDPNKTRTCRIIKEKNAEVKASLPGPAYYVTSSEINQAVLETLESARDMDDDSPMPMKSLQVHGTFMDQAAATARMHEGADRIAGRVPGAEVTEPIPTRTDENASMPYTVMSIGIAGSVKGENQFWFVSLQRDSGVLNHPEN